MGFKDGSRKAIQPRSHPACAGKARREKSREVRGFDMSQVDCCFGGVR